MEEKTFATQLTAKEANFIISALCEILESYPDEDGNVTLFGDSMNTGEIAHLANRLEDELNEA